MEIDESSLSIQISYEEMLYLSKQGFDLAGISNVLDQYAEYYLYRSQKQKLWCLVKKHEKSSLILASKHFNPIMDRAISELWVDAHSKFSSPHEHEHHSKHMPFKRFGMNQGWG